LAAGCNKQEIKYRATTNHEDGYVYDSSNDEQLTMNNINQLLNVTFTTLLREKRYVLVAGTQAAMRRENGRVGE